MLRGHENLPSLGSILGLAHFHVSMTPTFRRFYKIALGGYRLQVTGAPEDSRSCVFNKARRSVHRSALEVVKKRIDLC